MFAIFSTVPKSILPATWELIDEQQHHLNGDTTTAE